MTGEAILTAEVGAARLVVCVADITTLESTPSSTPRIRRCLAGAGWMAPSTGPPDRNSWPNAGRSAVARPARPRSPAATGFKASHVIHAVGPVWSGGGATRTNCSPAATAPPCVCRVNIRCLDRVSRDLDRHLPLSADLAARSRSAPWLGGRDRTARFETVVFCCFSADGRRASQGRVCGPWACLTTKALQGRGNFVRQHRATEETGLGAAHQQAPECPQQRSS